MEDLDEYRPAVPLALKALERHDSEQESKQVGRMLEAGLSPSRNGLPLYMVQNVPSNNRPHRHASASPSTKHTLSTL
ncbi:hypothetical protein [Sporisorium scitamineum]|uniref:Uncharacterized protein n=1 Tax=Sporisorium scitamineum TaxID=49012 RepID=A0A0F7S2H4_9BASI|nr:hypothetical protein [Sporisorium scitamineum]